MTKDETLKLALEALEEWYFGCGAGSESHDDAVEAIKQALAAPVQEPVGEIGWGGSVNWHKTIPEFGTDLYTTPPAAPVQEPVAWMQDSIELYVQDRPSAYYTIPLYTTPPAAQRQWMGLTDEEVDAAIKSNWGEMKGGPLVLNRTYVRAIEAKLKEKNT